MTKNCRELPDPLGMFIIDDYKKLIENETSTTCQSLFCKVTLVGGTGNDQLKGGAGVDVYQFNGSYGTDVITDTDGQGFISINDTPANSGTLKLENIYKNDSTGYTFTKLNEGHTIAITKAGDANRIIINDWSATHNLSLNLTRDNPTAPAATLSGDFKKKIDDHGTTDTSDDTYVITNGNYTVDETAPDGEANDDTVWAGNGNDILMGGTGNDEVFGGDDNDYIDGEAEDDNLIGGYGADEIYGGAGNDELTGDLPGLEGTNPAAPPAATNFSLMGNDTLDGGAGKNLHQIAINNEYWRMAA